MTDIIKMSSEVFFPNYTRFPVVFTHGQGYHLFDEQGRKYIDFVAGIAVCNMGHANPQIAQVICEQAGQLLHVSNLYYTKPQTLLAQMLCENSFASKVFFCNSGAEANEAAIKLARLYFAKKGVQDRFQIISMEKSFHGRTMATLSATGQDKIKKGFEPLLPGFTFIPFNDLSALKDAVSDKTCAVITEPVQGEGGVNCPDPEFLQQVRQVCNDCGALLIFDEIQTGMGRTGKLFGYQHFDVLPDIMTLAKALGNGLPIGAMLAKAELGDVFSPGTHASTFGGTPIVTSAALETLRLITQTGILDNCANMGAYLMGRLTEMKAKHDCIKQVRGIGLLIGMELSIPGDAIVKHCLENGFVINCVQGNVLRFIPPLIIDKQAIDALIDCLDQAFA